MPLCNDKDTTVGHLKEIDVDAALDDLFHDHEYEHEKASEIQPCGPGPPVMASALIKALYDPSNPSNFSKDYQGSLKELV